MMQKASNAMTKLNSSLGQCVERKITALGEKITTKAEEKFESLEAKRAAGVAKIKETTANAIEDTTGKLIGVVDKAVKAADTQRQCVQEHATRFASSANSMTERLRSTGIQENKEHRRAVSVLEGNVTYYLTIHEDESTRVSPPNDIYRAASTGHARALDNLLGYAEHHLIQSYLEFLDENERTPLLIACANGNIECVRLLLEHGANHTAVDDLGNTSVHLACLHGHVAIVNLLLTHPTRRTTPYVLNKKGLSALRLARLIVQTKKEGWQDVVKCIEELEQRCKVFEGWVYHRSHSLFAWQTWEARYALILRTGSSLFLEMHLFDVQSSLRTPIPILVFDIDVHKPVTLYREGDGLNRKPLAIGLENQVLAAFNEEGFASWSHFLTAQASLAVHDPNDGSAASSSRQSSIQKLLPSPKQGEVAKSQMVSQPSPRLDVKPSANIVTPRKGKELHAFPTQDHTLADASAPAWEEVSPRPTPTPILEEKRAIKLDSISTYVNHDVLASTATVPASAPILDDEEYGSSSAYARTREECVVCLDRSKQTVCVPCGHVAACMPCAEKLQRTTRSCPVCRTEVREIVKLFLA